MAERKTHMAGRQLSLLPTVPLVQSHPAGVDCPLCGRSNPLERTFRCRGCDTPGFCRTHLDAEARLCPECAKLDAQRRQRAEADRASKAQPHAIYSRWPFDAAEAKRRQDTTAAALRIPVEHDFGLGQGVRMRMVLIPAGQFDMGSPPFGQDPQPGERLHRVRITQPFYIGQCPVTQAQWQAATGANPSRFQGAELPVEQVSWHDCLRFAEKVNAAAASSVPRSACPTVPSEGGDTAGRASRGTAETGLLLTLPTEAQWEYACRAGAATRFGFGDADAGLDPYAWYYANSADTTHPVGLKRPNAWRLHDCHGNVWEWCADWYGLSYFDASPERDPEGPAAGGERVARGGSWRDHPARVCCARRNHLAPSHQDDCLGFRLVAAIARGSD